MKRYFFLMMMSAYIYGSENFGGNAEIAGGIINVNNESKAALKLSISPEFKISKLSMGAKIGIYMGENIPMDINGDGKSNSKDIDFGLKFLGWDGDIFKFRYGTFDGYTLGHGTLISNYSNNEKTSLGLGLKDSENKIGAEVFFPLEKDIFGAKIEEKDRPGSMGARVFVKPLKYTNLDLPIIDKLELGFTYGEDTRDKYNGINTDGSFENKTGSTELKEYSGHVKGIVYEISLPLIENRVVPYYNRVQIKTEKDKLEDGSTGKDNSNLSGDFLGVMGKVSLLSYKFEYRNIDSGLTPGYFGKLYEVKYNQNLDRALNNSNEKISGYFGEVDANFGGIINLSGSYEDYDKDDLNPHLVGQLDLFLSKKLQAKISYDQIDLGSELHKDKYFNEDTVIFANIIAPAAFIGIPGPVTAKLNIKQNYNFNEVKAKYEPTRIYSLGLAMEF